MNGTDFWWTETSYAAGTLNTPSQAAVNQVFADRPAGANILPTHNFFLNDDGTLYSSANLGFPTGLTAPTTADPFNPGGTYRYKGPIDGVFRKRTTNGLGAERHQRVPLDSAESLFAVRPRRLGVQRLGVLVPAGPPVAEPC